jgi:hypothetical protein
MKIQRFFFFALMVLLSSCDDPEHKHRNTNCEFDIPVNEVPWIAELLAEGDCSMCEVSVFSARYDNGPVIYLNITDPLCDVMFDITIYDCAGEAIRHFESDDYDEFQDTVTDSEVLYRCES